MSEVPLYLSSEVDGQLQPRLRRRVSPEGIQVFPNNRGAAMAAPQFYIACAPRRLTRRTLKLRAVPSGIVLNLRTIAEQK